MPNPVPEGEGERNPRKIFPVKGTERATMPYFKEDDRSVLEDRRCIFVIGERTGVWMIVAVRERSHRLA